jgi:hypothetical protein
MRVESPKVHPPYRVEESVDGFLITGASPVIFIPRNSGDTFAAEVER